MTFKLSAQLDHEDINPNEPFQKYKEYVEENRSRFPSSVLNVLEDDRWYGGSNTISPYYSHPRSISLANIGRNNARLDLVLEKGDYLVKPIEICISYIGVYKIDIPTFDWVIENSLPWRYDQFLYHDGSEEFETSEKLFQHQIEWVGETILSVIARDINVEWKEL